MAADTLRFLADESCDRTVIAALRADSHDVYAMSENMTRSIDIDVLQQAAGQRRILLTEDKDFGSLVFLTRLESAGVILMRFPATARRSLVDSVRRVVHEYGDALIESRRSRSFNLGSYVLPEDLPDDPGYPRRYVSTARTRRWSLSVAARPSLEKMLLTCFSTRSR
jgi:predicted nuclease of predicted toxin-antitoxin system